MYHEYRVSGKSKCTRLKVILEDILPSMYESIESGDVENIQDILTETLPKLRAKAERLASELVKDETCMENYVAKYHISLIQGKLEIMGNGSVDPNA